MLVCYAKELKEGFVNYVEETTKLMVPLLRFYFHEGTFFIYFNEYFRIYSIQVFVLQLENLYRTYSIVRNYVVMIMFVKCGNI
jgi:hypothetical protein